MNPVLLDARVKFSLFLIGLFFCFSIRIVAAQETTARGLDEIKEPTELCLKLNEIIADYPNNFKSIKGDLLKRDEYQVKVSIPGAEESLLIEKVNEDFDVIMVYDARFSKEIPWEIAEAKIYEIGEDIGGCAMAGNSRFIHTFNDSDKKQLSIFLPHQPTEAYESLKLKLSISKKVVDDISYGIINLVIGTLD